MRQAERVVAPVVRCARQLTGAGRDRAGLVEAAQQREGERDAVQGPPLTDDVAGAARVDLSTLPAVERRVHVEVVDVGEAEREARVGAEMIVLELPADLERLLAALLGL